MMSEPSNPNENDRSIARLICIAALPAWAGLLLAFVYLLCFPPKRYSSVKDRDVFLEQKGDVGIQPGELYYFAGGVARGREWQLKLAVFLKGGNTTLEMTADELNACIASMLRPPSLPPAADAGNLTIVPKMPNVFVDEGEGIYFSLPADVTLFGSQRKLLVFARGHFTSGPDVRFKLEALYLNNAAIPVVGGLADRVLASLLKGYLQSEQFIAFRQAWAKVESVEVVANTLRLKLQ
jgi:hypothetical protein